MHSPIDVLQSFTEISPNLLDRLLRLINRRTFARHETVESRSLLENNVIFIEQGSARVFYIKGGKEKTFSFSFEDEYVMLSRQMINKPDITLVVEFLEPTSVLTLNPSQMRKEVNSEDIEYFPEATMIVNAALHQYSAYLEERLEHFQQTDATERYNWALNRYPRLLEVANLTQIASFLGLTRETLYRMRAGTYRK